MAVVKNTKNMSPPALQFREVHDQHPRKQESLNSNVRDRLPTSRAYSDPAFQTPGVKHVS